MAVTIFGKLSNVLNFSYQVYENEIFPKEKRDKIYIYHMITPEIMTCILYPLIGYLLVMVFKTVMAIITPFISTGLIQLIGYKSNFGLGLVIIVLVGIGLILYRRKNVNGE